MEVLGRKVFSHLGIAEQDNADDLVADVGAEILDGGSSEGGTLAVATGDNLCVGALAVGELEEVCHLCDGGAAGAAWKGVVADARRVTTADSLHPDVGSAEGRFKGIADVRAKGALQRVYQYIYLSICLVDESVPSYRSQSSRGQR